MFDVKNGEQQLLGSHQYQSYEAIAAYKNELLVMGTPNQILFFTLQMNSWRGIYSISHVMSVLTRDLICWKHYVIFQGTSKRPGRNGQLTKPHIKVLEVPSDHHFEKLVVGR